MAGESSIHLALKTVVPVTSSLLYRVPGRDSGLAKDSQHS